jgi:hypothetical protein
MNKQWINALESEMNLIHAIFGEPTLFGYKFMGPIHHPKRYNPTTDKLERICTYDGYKRIMIYADMNKINNYIKNK